MMRILILALNTGEHSITVAKPDRSVIQQQKTPVSTFGRTFYRPVLEHFYRQEGLYPLSIQFNDGADFRRVV
jgi:hypothetical protein